MSQEPQNEVVTEDAPVVETPTVLTIPAVNPTPEEVTGLIASIQEALGPDVHAKLEKFSFKRQVDKLTKQESMREALSVVVPYPSVEGTQAILAAGGKQAELVMDALEAIVNAQARRLIAADVNINAATLPLDKLTWEFIANIPKAQKGGGIAKEVWEAFAKDYIVVMQKATGKELERVTNAARILLDKFSKVRSNKKMITMLVGQLAIYSENSADVEKHLDCIEFLMAKADTLLKTEPEDFEDYL